MNEQLSRFTNLYSLSKTLRFELIPVGDTLANMERGHLLDNDERLAASYQQMKKTIDEFHKDFIERSLSVPDISLSGLDRYYALYTASPEEKKTDAHKKQWDEVRANLRKQIVKCFKIQPEFSKLDKKELIQTLLIDWINAKSPDLYYDPAFRNFTTYFTGYNENRMNMYSDEEKATAVSHRLIDENLPKFIDNLRIFEKISHTAVAECFPRLCADMEPYLNYKKLGDLFSLDSYSAMLTQRQIEAYNTIIGGKTGEEQGRKVQGLNEYINLYNQKHPEGKLPGLKLLYKQILSDRTHSSWLPDVFDNVPQLITAAQEFYRLNIESAEEAAPCPRIERALDALAEADTEKVYLRNDASLGSISQRLFGRYNILWDALAAYYEGVVEPDYHEKLKKAKNEKAAKKIEDERERFLQKPDVHSVALLERALCFYRDSLDPEQYADVVRAITEHCLTDYYSSAAFHALRETVQEKAAAAEGLLHSVHEENYRLTGADKEQLKALLDAMMELLHFVKPLYLRPGTELAKDEVFYGQLTPAFEALQEMTRLYDKVRNFVTKKPYSEEKIKLNFGCSTLLDGWDVNKETQNLGLLFLKDGNYYLGIMDKASNHVLEDVEEGTGDCYRKVQYKLLPGPNKMLPKVFFSASRIEEFSPSQRIMDIYERGSFKKGNDFNRQECGEIIDFFKASIEKHPDWKQFGFQFSETQSYDDISGFYREVSEQGYKITYKNISTSYIDRLVSDGKLYLFRIYNKDFSAYSTGKPNLHTLYWKALFDERNLSDVVYKLNGQAEVFYRKKSLKSEETTIHPANEPLAAKNPERKGSSVFPYEIVKDRRYTVDKFQFHVPVTMNFKAGGANINDMVCGYLKGNPDVHILGIDRGERHLLYISMIDRQGNVVRDKNGRMIQYSLNTITGAYKNAAGETVSFSTPYHELLGKKEKEREDARESWGTVENIKELKAGYLSQVVHHIAALMVEYNAIVVLEDLNGGFKNSRKKVERQVYQNFEKALIQKLNYLVFKDVPVGETGGLYHALQLTAPFESFAKMRKQSGFLFYVPAWNTSKIDPVTGFTDLLKPKYTSIPAAQDFFRKFEAIRYNPEKDYFEFSFDYDKFTEKAKGTRTKWTVCTVGKLRYRYNRALNNNNGGYEKRDVTESIRNRLEEAGIAYADGRDIRHAICAADSAPFLAGMIKDLQLVLALRYSCPEDGKDFILSPVADEKGEFFNSDEVRAKGLALPQDADANGAFNIARKGLWVLEKMDRAEKYTGWTTDIPNRDWLSYVQTRFH